MNPFLRDFLEEQGAKIYTVLKIFLAQTEPLSIPSLTNPPLSMRFYPAPNPFGPHEH